MKNWTKKSPQKVSHPHILLLCFNWQNSSLCRDIKNHNKIMPKNEKD